MELISSQSQKSNNSLSEADNELREQDRFNEFKSILSIIAYYLTTPLFLLFWICDIFYAPELKYEFLSIRLLIIPLTIISAYINYKSKSLKVTQLNGLFLTFSNSILITAMILFRDQALSPYYAGLNLVAIGSITFMPWRIKFIWAPILATFAPFYLGVLYISKSWADYNSLIINSFFIAGTVSISIIIRIFLEKVRLKEFISRINLKNEIESRNDIIKVKTNEAVVLNQLSQQFSPQVVSAIRNGNISIDSGVHRTKLCAIFIDIVNSTERVTRIDKDNVDKVISMFLEDTNTILLKYDVTIDKFLGDGILAFSNDPIKHDDYMERVVKAALEIRMKINERQHLYEDFWLAKLQICVGIATGYANVGFYGSSNYYHSYTAIGPVVNLASRLCSVAEPDQILITNEVYKSLDHSSYILKSTGTKKLKGFENDIIKTFEVKDVSNNTQLNTNVNACPECQKIMHIDTNEKGFYVFKCHSCGYEMDENQPKKAA